MNVMWQFWWSTNMIDVVCLNSSDEGTTKNALLSLRCFGDGQWNALPWQRVCDDSQTRPYAFGSVPQSKGGYAK